MKDHLQHVSFPPIVKIASQALSLAPKEKKLISFGQGVPFFGPPSLVLKEILQEWMDPNHSVHRYNLDQGLYSLRKSIASYENRHYNLPELDPDKEIMITAGANQACFNVIKSLCSPGDEIIVFSPFYFNHEMAGRLENLHIRLILVQKESLLIDIDGLNNVLSEKTRLIILVNPNNPTGVLEPRTTIKKLVELVNSYENLWLMADETYAEFIYDKERTGSFCSVGAHQDTIHNRVVIVRSFSKTWGMAGWRLGYIIFPERLLEPLLKVQDTLIVSPPVPAQLLAQACLQWDENETWFSKRLEEINEVRINLLNFLRSSPSFDVSQKSFTGTAAFYMFPRLALEINMTSDKFVEELVRSQGVLLLPGSAFGQKWNRNIRISFGNVTLKDLQLGIERIEAFCNQII